MSTEIGAVVAAAAEGIPHRREDGELVGWIHESGDDWVAVDVLGRVASAPVDWIAAEEALEQIGLRFLMDAWMLDGEGPDPLRVKIVEVSPSGEGRDGRIVVKIDDYGDIQRPPSQRFTLGWPLPERLRPPRDGDPDGHTLNLPAR
ncbi:hypothetical protein GCM10025768_04770 [Microbacterium pseudoresistens]|uniref:Uncharacterized protein n=1 Tax=Microbacterium pseudoresistens TaxID=640634 RepID=A0A7Y9EUP8_9MICO|nr:hypothetical protein [Microbacterium pseudoresistens]NYD54312.1 hypothetical protein [Microbacterium pseudoresistens]